MEPLWGDQTEAAVLSFGRKKTPRKVVRAYAEVKKAAVLAQQETAGIYPEKYFPCLLSALDEVIEGKLDDHFPLSLRQGGAGTSLHMNLNEVAANRANQLYRETLETDAAEKREKDGAFWSADPLKDINRFQSTNDTFPTAVKAVVYREIQDIERTAAKLQEALVEKEGLYGSLLVTGRTELQDALPMTLGQVFGGWAGMLERDRWRFMKLLERVRLVALGGTAVGTCFSAPRNYIFAAERHLRIVTGLPLGRSQNLPDEVAHQDALSEAAAGIRVAAGNAVRIAGDLLLYTSSFLGELEHPNLQYGSTIMPFKTNPVLLEFARGCALAAGGEAVGAVDFCDEGQLQLNSYLPFFLDFFLQAAGSLKTSHEALTRFVRLVETRPARIMRNIAGSPALFNALLELIDYRELKTVAEKLSVEDFSDIQSAGRRIAELTGRKTEEILSIIDPNRKGSRP